MSGAETGRASARASAQPLPKLVSYFKRWFTQSATYASIDVTQSLVAMIGGYTGKRNALSKLFHRQDSDGANQSG